jgi:hypothetical protein
LRLEFQTLLANLLFLELLASQLFLVKKLEKRRSKEFHQLQYLKLNHQFQRELLHLKQLKFLTKNYHQRY